MEHAYFAHIAADGRTQTVLEHLTGTAALSGGFASVFGAEALGQLAGMCHDLGKYSAEFQKRIRGDPAHVDHATAGALTCLRLGQPPAAFAVMGHHGGLPDLGYQTDADTTFLGRIQKGLSGQIPDYSHWTEELSLAPPAPRQHLPPLEEMFFTRMLYSCLVDGDYPDTEAFMDGAPRKRQKADISGLLTRLKDHISPWFPPQNPLNAQRCAILRQCLERGEQKKPGLYTLTVPTGGGKTVSSLAFALAHAQRHGLGRVFYVVPYTSIIEQTADTFRTILGSENVLEHHSGACFDTQEYSIHAKATENWDMPVVVTTSVQFFEPLYGARPSKCRKLHNLAGSVIIFDEAQMLPLPYLRPCVFAISQLVKHYGVSAVLCTATQPALNPIFREFLSQEPEELCPPPIFAWDDFRRVSFQRAGTLSWEALAQRMQAQSQVLSIVNSRKSAQSLFEQLEPDGRFHLSTLMCPAHRRLQLQEIRSRLASGQTCRVVSTSLVEAGVDVDFPALFREEAGLDSILQAAGRCNREGKRPAAKSVVTIFKSEAPPPPLFRTAIDVSRMVMDRHEDLGEKAVIADYFRELLAFRGPRAQDREGILPMIEEKYFPFQTVADRFHLIDQNTQTVYIPYNGEAQELLEKLRRGETSRTLFRKLGSYSVNVYPQHFQSLSLELLADGNGVLLDMTLYREDTGLSLTADSGQALFV